MPIGSSSCSDHSPVWVTFRVSDLESPACFSSRCAVLTTARAPTRVTGYPNQLLPSIDAILSCSPPRFRDRSAAVGGWEFESERPENLESPENGSPFSPRLLLPMGDEVEKRMA